MIAIFLILLAGGIMLAVACPAVRSVTRQWLRLGSVLALCAILSAGFLVNFAGGYYRIALAGIVVHLIVTLAGLRWAQRLAGIFSFAFCLAAATGLMPAAANLATAGGVSAICGLSLMELLLARAFQRSTKMTMAPLRRLNRVLGLLLFLRLLETTADVEFVQLHHPVAMLWMKFAWLAAIRWTLGLIVPLVLIYLTGVCIRRRATPSATSILYLLCVLTFAGEWIGLWMAIKTGLPF